MYRDQKPPESIKTTETHQRTHKVTLDTNEIRQSLMAEGLLRTGLEAVEGVITDVYIHTGEINPATLERNVTATVTITEILPTPTGFAPLNIEEIVRLNPPATPGLSQRQIDEALKHGREWRGTNPYNWPMPAGDDLIFATDGLGVLRVDGPVKHLGTTSPTSKLNVNGIGLVKKEQPDDLAIEDLMKRVNKLHDVLLHGKGNNIVLTPGEVDTVLEYTNVGNQGKGSYAVPPYTEPMNLPMPEGASVLSAARSGPVGVAGSVVELTNWECIDGKWGRSF